MEGLPTVRHFSTFPHGGAGAAALGIHQGLQTIGLDSQFYYRRNQSHEPTATDCHAMAFPEATDSATGSPAPGSTALRDRLNVPRQWARRVEKQRVRRIISHYQNHLEGNDRFTEVFSQAEEIDHTPAQLELRSGILHLHWTAYGFDWPSFFSSIPENHPIIWTLHDQNPFTGGCHYTTGCEKFASGCGNCPQLLNAGVKDLSRWNFELKRQALRHRNLHVVAPSLWLLQQAKRSEIFQDAVSFTHIPYGMDQQRFADPNTESIPPLQQAIWNTSHRNLIPTILLGAQDLNNPRKGISFALEALRIVMQMRQQPLRLWTFGSGIPQSLLKPLGENLIVQQWGFVRDQALLGRLYRRADTFLLPSLEDNQPQTALEAMAHGTPVVGFTVGGVPEVVRDGLSGFCVPPQDAQQMADRLQRLLDQKNLRHQLGNAARLQIQTEHDVPQQATLYRELYRQAMLHAGSLPISA